MTGLTESPSAQGDVAVHAFPIFPGLANCVRISEPVCKISRLMFLDGLTFVADNFLYRHDVGIDLLQHPGNAVDTHTAIQPAAFVDVVSRYAEGVHSHTWFSISDASTSLVF